MKWIDLHCDTLMKAYAVSCEKEGLYRNEYCVDFEKMLKGHVVAQFFAIWMPEESGWKKLTEGGAKRLSDEDYVDQLFKGFYRSLDAHGDIISFAGNADDLKNNEKKGRMSAFLTLEDGRMVRGRIKNIEELYKKGVRLITLTWNEKNCFGSPNSEDTLLMQEGLTKFGKEAISYMNDQGILIDVSHLSDGGFYDVAKISRKPFIASHSNARALAPHSRNMTDDMIKTLAECGGVMGLNFAPPFLNEDLSLEFSRIESLCAHARHITNVGGIECLGLGTDFDGVDGIMEIKDSSCLPLLWEALKKSGFSENELDCFSYKNAMRLIDEVL